MTEAPVDAAELARNKEALEKEGEAILALHSQGEASHYDIGQHYNNIVDGDLAEKAGYHTVQQYFAAKLKGVRGLSTSNLVLYGRAAKAYPRESAAKYGVTDLGAFLTYAALTHLSPIPSDPGAASVQVPQQDGSVLEKKFADCPLAELSAAIKHLKKPDSSLSPNEVEMAKHLLAIVDHTFGVHSPALAKVQKGAEEPIVVFHVPFSQLPTLQHALTEFIGLPSPAGVLAAVAGTLGGASTLGPTPGSAANEDVAIELGRRAGQQWKNFKRLFS